jgi:hypothetical protein
MMGPFFVAIGVTRKSRDERLIDSSKISLPFGNRNAWLPFADIPQMATKMVKQARKREGFWVPEENPRA